MSEDRSALSVTVALIAAVAGGGGTYAFRNANDVPPPEAQESAKILALLERELPAIRQKLELRLESLRDELDETNEKLISLRDRVGDVCGTPWASRCSP